ncbi:MAG: hypothetical protein ACREGI_04570 [Candidatus Levyibacteriota bacterium]
MEIALIPQGVRIKTKQAQFLVDPVDAKAKNPVEATLLLDGNGPLLFPDYGVVLSGPGEYEVRGTKITGMRFDNTLFYDGSFDGVQTLITKTSSLAKAKDLKEFDVAIFQADDTCDQAAIIALNPKVVIFHGPKAKECAALLGKEPQKTNKFVSTKDKLPEELTVIVF